MYACTGMCVCSVYMYTCMYVCPLWLKLWNSSVVFLLAENQTKTPFKLVYVADVCVSSCRLVRLKERSCFSTNQKLNYTPFKLVYQMYRYVCLARLKELSCFSTSHSVTVQNSIQPFFILTSNKNLFLWKLSGPRYSKVLRTDLSRDRVPLR
jgi:hypothetical protein